MIPIKIQCACGQRYAFDVEPVAGRMPGAVCCPICGADGTTAANTALAQKLGAPPIAVPMVNPVLAAPSPGSSAGGKTVRVAAPALAAAAPAQLVATGSDPGIKLPPPPTSTRSTIATAPEPTKPAERPRLPGQMEPERAEAEAQSKIMWGDDPKEVTNFS
jgi:hypothetical protein